MCPCCSHCKELSDKLHRKEFAATEIYPGVSLRVEYYITKQGHVTDPLYGVSGKETIDFQVHNTMSPADFNQNDELLTSSKWYQFLLQRDDFTHDGRPIGCWNDYKIISAKLVPT